MHTTAYANHPTKQPRWSCSLRRLKDKFLSFRVLLSYWGCPCACILNIDGRIQRFKLISTISFEVLLNTRHANWSRTLRLFRPMAFDDTYICRLGTITKQSRGSYNYVHTIITLVRIQSIGIYSCQQTGGGHHESKHVLSLHKSVWVCGTFDYWMCPHNICILYALKIDWTL